MHIETNLLPAGDIKELEDKYKIAVNKNILYKREVLEAIVDDPRVKEVRVFKLKAGMVVYIGGTKYKVVTVRQNGKATLRPA